MTTSLGSEYDISAILICSQDGVIGYDGGLAFSILEDFKRFKERTQGCVLLMGYKTAAEIFKMNPKGLPGREIAVLLTRDLEVREDWHEKVMFVDSINDILPLGKIMVSGGATIYDQFAPTVSQWHVTIVDLPYATLHPGHDPSKTVKISEITQEIIKSRTGVVQATRHLDRLTNVEVPVNYFTSFKS